MLRSHLQSIFKSHECIYESYLIAEINFKFIYWNEHAHQYFHGAMLHLRSEMVSENSDIDLFVLPSCLLSSSSSMIEVRKTFFSQVCIANYIDPLDVDVENMVSICGTSYFYVLAKDAHIAIWVFNDQLEIPIYQRPSPFLSLFYQIFNQFNAQAVHCSAISDGEKAVLFTGPSGSGKSTTALLCVNNGYSYLGEDYCVLKHVENQVFVYSLYRYFKLTNSVRESYDLSNFTKIFEMQGRSWYKYVYAPQNKDVILNKAPIKAICGLKILDSDSPSLQEQTMQESLKSLMLSTMQEYPTNIQSSIQQFVRYCSLTLRLQLSLCNNNKMNIGIINELFNL